MAKAELFLSLLVIFGIANAIPFKDVSENRIVGGTNTTDGQYPFMVSIRITLNNHFCGGVILNQRTILTAAGCLNWIPVDKIEAVVGTNLLNQGGVRFRAQELKVHPNFDEMSLANDIGLFITILTIGYTPRIQPIELEEIIIGSGIDGRFLGWGRTSTIHNLSNNLLFLDMDVISRVECQTRFGSNVVISENHLCGFRGLGRGGCTRDYGGPLIADGKVIALYSFGAIVNDTQCAIGYPDVFTRVSSYINWIEANKEV